MRRRRVASPLASSQPSLLPRPPHRPHQQGMPQPLTRTSRSRGNGWTCGRSLRRRPVRMTSWGDLKPPAAKHGKHTPLTNLWVLCLITRHCSIIFIESKLPATTTQKTRLSCWKQITNYRRHKPRFHKRTRARRRKSLLLRHFSRL